MIGLRLVRLIEGHSHKLAHGVVEKLLASERTPELRRIPAQEMEQAVNSVFSHLGDWLLTKTDSDIELRYTELGRKRAVQGIPISQLIWALLVTKEHLWAYLQRESFAERATELIGELELLQLLDHFYDRAVYYVTCGYERALAERKAA